MKPDYEFRCYVHNRTVTAISQYHCYCRFEALQDLEHVEKIRSAICTFHEETKNSFSVPSYVIDIAVDPEDYSCQVIELNPFGKTMSSGSGLFHWERDGDLLYDNLNREVPAIRILEHLKESKKSGSAC